MQFLTLFGYRGLAKARKIEILMLFIIVIITIAAKLKAATTNLINISAMLLA
jgi:hypothetical protein